MAVEFALVVPVLLLLIFGAMQYSLYFFSMQAGSQAVREAARRASVGDMPLCTSGTEPFVDYVRSRVGSANFGNPITVTRTYSRASGNTGTDVQTGDLVRVEVAFRSVDMGIPFFPVPGGDARISSVADSRVERVLTPPEACP